MIHFFIYESESHIVFSGFRPVSRRFTGNKGWSQREQDSRRELWGPENSVSP